MLGNAVPSLVTEVLARAMRVQFLGDRKRSASFKLLPPSREPIPPPEPIRPVPIKYHHLVGKHDDHPGEGKGAGARRRAKDDAQASFFADAE